MSTVVTADKSALIIKDGAIVADEWQLLAEDATNIAALTGKWLAPLSLWQTQGEKFKQRGGVAPWLNSDEHIEELPEIAAERLNDLPLIALNFALLSDGRSFSQARLLRQRYGYRNELRAIGSFMRDQLYYLARCGFNAFALQDEAPLEEALPLLKTFHTSYQAACDEPLPLFKRRRLDGAQ